MLTRCPYPECRHDFEVDYQLPEGDWHWKQGQCPACKLPASLRPIEVMQNIERLYEKRELAGTLGSLAKDTEKEHVLTAVVEDVRSLWNVGSIFRTSDGAGVSSLSLCGITGCPPRKEIAKTSLGADETVNWRYYRSAIEILRLLKSNGYLILGLERNEESQLLADTIARQILRAPLCIVLGNEVMGVSAESLSLCDLVCHLPMRGVKESLNVAVAFGVASYAVADFLAIEASS